MMAICQSRFSRVCVCVSVGTAEGGGDMCCVSREHNLLRETSFPQRLRLRHGFFTPLKKMERSIGLIDSVGRGLLERG